MSREKELLEKGYEVVWTLTTEIPTKAGIVDKFILGEAKADFIKQTMEPWKDDFVRISQGYPKDTYSDVIFDIDVVVMKREHYEELLELADNE